MEHPTAEKTIRKRVRKACLHCKKAKTSCSDVRPCKRCVRLHLSDTCIDPPSSSSSAEGLYTINEFKFIFNYGLILILMFR